MIQYRKGDIQAAGDITAYSSYTPSDIRLKTNIQPISVNLDSFSSVGSYTYEWNSEINRPGTEYGFIAQEMQGHFPMLVHQKNFDDKEMLIVDYQKTVVVLWNVVQQLQAKIKTLEEKFN